MTDHDKPPRFFINNGRLYQDSEEHGVREVTHVKRMDGGGIDYMELRVSGDQVSAGHSVGNPSFTFTLTPEGHPEGKRPGGYEYAWVIAEPEAEPDAEPMAKTYVPKGTDFIRVDPHGNMALFRMEDAGRLRRCTLPAACHTKPDPKGGYIWRAALDCKTSPVATFRWQECRREPVAEGGYRWLVLPGPRAPSLITRDRW